MPKMLVGDKDTALLIPAYEVDGVPHLLYPSGEDSIDDVSAALLNYYIDALTPGSTGGSWGGNITCAIIDDWSLGLTDSDTDDTRTLCSVGQSAELTFYNYDAQFNFLRDAVLNEATSEFNLARNLTAAPDLQYVIAHRLGYSRNVDAAIGQEWHFYYVHTDHSVPAYSDGGWQGLGQTFIPKGIINFKYELEA